MMSRRTRPVAGNREGDKGGHHTVVLDEFEAERLRELLETGGFWKGRSLLAQDDTYQFSHFYAALEGVRGTEAVCFETLDAMNLVVYKRLRDTLMDLCGSDEHRSQGEAEQPD